MKKSKFEIKNSTGKDLVCVIRENQDNFSQIVIKNDKSLKIERLGSELIVTSLELQSPTKRLPWWKGKLQKDVPYVAGLGGNNAQEITLTSRANQVIFRDLERILKELKDSAIQAGFMVTIRNQVDYDRAREISNSYFDYYPAAVALPKTVEDVSACVRFCRKHSIQLRIRSGGHHHEAMCSANNVLVVRLSEMNTITYMNAEKTTAWIPAGKKLQNVYYELELYKKYIPGGGCQSVNTGGLTQGGGWGAGTRKFGMTCDNILEAEVVLADGRIVYANAHEDKDLFWALRGGGGGNFGIVTRFLFKLHNLIKVSTTTINIPRKYANAVIETWMETMPKSSDDIIATVFLASNYLVERKASDNIRVFARCHGTKALLKNWVDHFKEEVNLKIAPNKLADGEKTEFPIVEFDFQDANAEPFAMMLQEHDNLTFQEIYQGPPNMEALVGDAAEQGQTPAPPRSTCDAPHPHKVSSAFQTKKKSASNDKALVKKIVAFANEKVDFPGANAFITLHALGGKSRDKPEGGRAYFFGDRDYLLQFQTWWSNPKDGKSNDYIKWVTGFRQEVSGHVEGAFINFVDKNLPVAENASELEKRLELLAYYYGENLKKLRKIKHAYDPDNFYQFQMSIPPEAKA